MVHSLVTAQRQDLAAAQGTKEELTIPATQLGGGRGGRVVHGGSQDAKEELPVLLLPQPRRTFLG